MRLASLRGIGVATCVVIGGAIAAGCTALLGAYEVTTEGGSEGGTDSGADGPIVLSDGAIVCGNPTVACGALCVDTANDPKNCGGCGAACASGPCAAGNCTDLKCDAPKTKCGNVCTDLKTDNDHCGSCPKKCIATHRCIAGDCTAVCTAPEVACSLPAGASKCVNTATDDAHCGSCNKLCAANETCTTGRCQPRPIMRYRLENDGANIGSLGPMYPFTPDSGMFIANGKFGRAYAGYGNVKNARQILGVTAKITISMWLNATAQPTGAFLDIWQNLDPGPYGGVQLGWSAPGLTFCVGSKGNKHVNTGGGCDSFAPPTLNAWHNYIIRYEGTGQGDNQGGPVDFYLDGVLAVNVINLFKEVVFNASMKNDLALGLLSTVGAMDEVRVYDRVFDQPTQCQVVIGGTWNGASCVLPN